MARILPIFAALAFATGSFIAPAMADNKPSAQTESAAEADDMKCGAAGDGCQPKEWQDYNEAATKAFPTWPEVGFRYYASGCMEASKKIKKLCLENPKKAAAALGLDK